MDCIIYKTIKIELKDNKYNMKDIYNILDYDYNLCEKGDTVYYDLNELESWIDKENNNEFDLLEFLENKQDTNNQKKKSVELSKTLPNLMNNLSLQDNENEQPLEFVKNKIIYILTNDKHLNDNIFKVGITEKDKLSRRLATYNTGAAWPYYYAHYEEVYNAHLIEQNIQHFFHNFKITVIDRAQNKKKISREMFQLHYQDLKDYFDKLVDFDNEIGNFMRENHLKIENRKELESNSLVTPIILNDENNRNKKRNDKEIIDLTNYNEEDVCDMFNEVLNEYVKDYETDIITRETFRKLFEKNNDCEVKKENFNKEFKKFFSKPNNQKFTIKCYIRNI